MVGPFFRHGTQLRTRSKLERGSEQPACVLLQHGVDYFSFLKIRQPVKSTLSQRDHAYVTQADDQQKKEREKNRAAAA
jgi:hypothetical protein